MNARLATTTMVVFLAFPAAGSAQDNPWTMFREIFREPVTELKQQFNQLRPPGRTKTAPKPKAAAATPEAPRSAPEAEPVPAPIPVARPVPDTLGPAPKSPSEPLQTTPLQGNSSILIDEVGAGNDTDAGSGAAATAADVAESGPAFSADKGPAEPAVENAPSAAEEEEQLAEALAPIPRPRPENAIAYAAVGSEPSASNSAAAIGALVAPLPDLAEPPPAARSTCGVALARLGVEAKPIAAIEEGACGVSEPVAVAALGGGAVDFTTKAIVGCELAEALANWLKDEAQPAAQKFLDGKIVGVRVAASYTCRTRNGVDGAKLSEHARGNAIDISAFNIDGRGWINVGGAQTPAAARFMAAIRKSACGPFKTVLGPGSDAYHSDHFHFDLAQRKKRGKSRGLYCR